MDNDPLAAGLRAAVSRLRGFAGMLSGLTAPITGLLSIAGAAAATKHFAEVGNEMQHMAERTGLSVEELSKLKFAAQMADVEMGDLEMAIKKMQRGGFGRGVQDLDKIADRIAKIEDPARRTQLALQIFGKSGTTMIPMLKDGAAGLREMREQAEATGRVMSSKTAADASRLDDAIKLLKMQVSGLGMSLGAALAPLATDLINFITPGIQRLVQYIKEFRAEVPNLGLAFKLMFAQATVWWYEFMTAMQRTWINGNSLIARSWIGTLSLMARAKEDWDASLARGFVRLAFMAGRISAEQADQLYANINQESKAEQDRTAAGYLKRVAEIQADAERALAGLGGSLADARAKLDALKRQMANERMLAAGPRLENVRRGFTDFGEGVGTFSTAAALRFAAGGGPIKQGIDNLVGQQADANKLLEQIRDRVGRGGLVFG